MNELRKKTQPESRRLALVLFAVVALTGLCSAAPPNQCTDDPVVVTITSGPYQDPTTLLYYNPGILPDGLGDYVDGQSGVEAKIRKCGTGDATVLLGSSKRTFTLDLRNVVSSNAATPSWTSVVDHFINIRNVLYNYNPATTYSFTTHLGSQLASPNANYYFQMQNPNSDTGGVIQGDANTPCFNALVHVLHLPATGATKETWIAWPDSGTPSNCTNGATPVQVGTLFHSTKSYDNVGQFSVPFYITIRRP